MTAARPRFDLPPRGITDVETAGHIGLALPAFNRLLPRLEAEGFPKPDSLTGRRDVKAIDHWMDVRAGLAADGSDNGLLAKIEEFRRAS